MTDSSGHESAHRKAGSSLPRISTTSGRKQPEAFNPDEQTAHTVGDDHSCNFPSSPHVPTTMHVSDKLVICKTHRTLPAI